MSVLIDLDFPADVNLAVRLMLQPGGLNLYEPPLPKPEAPCAVELTPLAAAAWSFDVRLARALLRSPGIDVSAGAPLLQAVRDPDLFLAREALLRSPCTLRRYPISGPKSDQFDVILLLLQANADPNQYAISVMSPPGPNTTGYIVVTTPLVQAAVVGDSRIVHLLVRNGGDPHATDCRVRSAYDLCWNPATRRALDNTF